MPYGLPEVTVTSLKESHALCSQRPARFTRGDSHLQGDSHLSEGYSMPYGLPEVTVTSLKDIPCPTVYQR